jgi:ketosteroid isomerase-like protein
MAPSMSCAGTSRRCSAATGRPAGFGFFADDVTLHVPGRSSLAGEHRGREAVEGYLRAALDRAHGAQVEVEPVFADPPAGG